MRWAPIHVVAVASSLASSADMGQCMGSAAANLACEPGPDAQQVGDSDLNGCAVRRKRGPMDPV
jgi:hypothetical protein